MIELWRIRYFVAVAEELHFSRAAARLHISQPALSQQIRALEDELGGELLRRTRRSVALTEAGKQLLVEGRQLLRHAELTADEVGRVARGEQGRLTVGFVGPAMEGVLPRALRSFRDRHPRSRLTVWHRGTDQQLQALRSGEQDIGLLRPYQHDLSGLETKLVERQPYLLALPTSHRLAARKRVSLSRLNSEPLILFPRTTHPALFDRMLQTCSEAGYQPEMLHEASTKSMALALVSANVGVALVPAGSTAESRAGVALCKVTDTLPLVEIVAARSADSASAMAETFMKELMAAAQARLGVSTKSGAKR